MKILLINPSCQYDTPLPTLSLAYLSAALKTKGHEALILDLWAYPLDDDELRRKIDQFGPVLIGITFFTVRYNETKELTDKIKSWFPMRKIAVGGSHPTALPENVLQEIKSIDFVVMGEGEDTIVELVVATETGNYDNINGLAYRNGDGITINQPRSYVQDIDELPFPDLAQFNPEKYVTHPPYGWYGHMLIMVTSRGCPGGCIYCSKSVYKNTWRSMSTDRLIREIKYAKEIWPYKEIRFYDDDFTFNKKRILDLCSTLITEKINLPWTCTTRVDHLSKELLIKMKEAGLYFITLGIESGSPKVLKELKKGYNVEQIKNAFKWCRELNIKTAAFFMVGLPGETREDMKMSLKLQREVKPNFVVWGTLRVLPGSKLFNTSMSDYKYNSDDKYPYFDILRKDMDEAFLERFCKKAMVRHYFSINGITSVLEYFLKTKKYKMALTQFRKKLQYVDK
ncbi:MAG: B12-binding domain-containing radical SAM protein [Candidatus Brocadiaceae bacterium]|nr:B12-binding domain-containing radical SAM protein [Candidatus Brocadiaceae bacterium]